jgi:TP901 family phage tail tape measure protein
MAGAVKDVTIKFNVETGEIISGKKEFDKLNKSVTQGSKQMTGSLNNMSKSILKMGAAYISLGAAKQIITDTVKKIATFEQSIADLGAITGATGKDLANFQKEVLRVSAATGKGASEIAKAFQIVGSAQPELLKSAVALGEVTKQAVLLAQAGGLEVPEAASALTLAMNQFGASAEDAAMFTDILANSQQKGTATISQLAESLKNVGSVAKSAGLSFEDTNVALQAMAKGGLIGAEAGTGLRAVLLRLQSAGVGFVDGQFNLQAAIKETKARFEAIEDPVQRVKEGTKLFGQENIKVGNTLMAQIGVLDEMTGSLNESGAALDQANKKMDTITGRTEKMSSAYERFIIGIDDGKGAIGGAIKDLQNMAISFFDLVDAGEELDKLGLTRTEQFGSEFSMSLTASAKAILQFKTNMEEQTSALALSGAGSIEYLQKISQVKTKMEGLNRDIPEQNAQYIILRNTLLNLGDAYKKLGDEVASGEEGEGEGGKAAENSAARLKRLKAESKARMDAHKQKISSNNEAAKLDEEEEQRLADSNWAEFDVEAETNKAKLEDQKEYAAYSKAINDGIVADQKKANDDELADFERKEALKKEMRDNTKTEALNVASAIVGAIAEINARATEQELEKLAEEEELALEKLEEDQEAEEEELQRQFDAGIISKEKLSEGLNEIDERYNKQKEKSQAEFDQKEKDAKIKAFNDQKKLSLVQAAILGAQTIMQAAAAAPPPANIPLIAGASAITAIQLGLIASQQVPAFKDGIIDLQGAGTGTSDSISARLSRGESVMTAKETLEHKPLLKAIRNNSLDDHLERIILQKLYSGKRTKKDIISSSQSRDVNFPDRMSISNARSISKPIVDAMEEQNFLNEQSWD